ncbi:unnamed protein product [Clavelina lepadiformis]|uniref:Ion transport domain-containing protein n=1 Tax=Clavelina lepadiformis TaxID=159417 RepID=A0ABP0FCW3_CLALP
MQIMDFCFHGNGGIVPVQDRIMRLNWKKDDERRISSALLGWAFVFLSLRLLRYVKVIPVLGVLQVSLGRMIVNVLQFIVIFIIVLLPFGLGMNEVFWYYKTPEVKEALCTDSADNDFCTETYFGSLPVTLKGLFWALFGYVDPYQLALDDSPPFTLWMANLLLGVYCVVAIIIMLNMLIAMMSKSFEDTSENAEIEWKFSKTVTWLRFIRGEVGVLPPFNMICLPWWCIKICKRKCASKASASYQQMPEEEDPEETKKKKEKEDRDVLMNELFDRYTKVNVPCS